MQQGATALQLISNDQQELAVSAPMTNKAYQSKLAAVEVEIARLRANRPPVPYRQIACDLHERLGIKVDAATVYRFVKVRSKGRKVYALPPLKSDGLCRIEHRSHAA